MVISGAHGAWQAVMRSAVTRGVSVTGAIRVGRAAGLATYRRTTMLSDFRAWGTAPAKANTIKYTPKAYRPSSAAYIETRGTMFRKFAYTNRITMRSGTTGTIEHFTTHISSDRQLSIGEIEEIGRDRFQPSVNKSGGQILSVTTIGALHKAGETWD